MFVWNMLGALIMLPALAYFLFPISYFLFPQTRHNSVTA